MKKRFLFGLLALLISTFACEPVIAIGKNELLCLLVLIVVLLGPPLYRFARRVEEFLKHEKRDK
jgi:hypothetical protein